MVPIETTHADMTEELAERQGRVIWMADTIGDHPDLALAGHRACRHQADDLRTTTSPSPPTLATCPPPSWPGDVPTGPFTVMTTCRENPERP